MIVDDIERDFLKQKVKPFKILVAPRLYGKILKEAASLTFTRHSSAEVEIEVDYAVSRWKFLYKCPECREECDEIVDCEGEQVCEDCKAAYNEDHMVEEQFE